MKFFCNTQLYGEIDQVRKKHNILWHVERIHLMEFKPGEICWQMADKQKFTRGNWGGMQLLYVFQRCANRWTERSSKKACSLKQPLSKVELARYQQFWVSADTASFFFFFSVEFLYLSVCWPAHHCFVFYTPNFTLKKNNKWMDMSL